MKLWMSAIVIIVIVAGSIIAIRHAPAPKSDAVATNTTDTSDTSTINTNQDSNTNMEKTEVKNGDVITVNYTGKLLNGTVFDSNVDPKFNHVEPFEFTVGAGMVIKGWDEGFLGMKVGEKKTLTIPADKAYGAQSPSPLIPANSTLVFDVELLGIK